MCIALNTLPLAKGELKIIICNFFFKSVSGKCHYEAIITFEVFLRVSFLCIRLLLLLQNNAFLAIVKREITAFSPTCTLVFYIFKISI